MSFGRRSLACGSLVKNLLLVGAFFVWLLPIQTTFAQDNAAEPRSDDARMIDGLRTRRLFDLAELHCREVLDSPNLTPAELAEFTIELIKTQTARAILSSSPQRESAWQAAQQTATQFLTEQKNHPRAFLVQVQSALSHLSRGQLLRQELSAEMVPESARDRALEELRKARTMLGDVQRGIVQKIPEQRGRTLDPDELSIAELMTLNNNVRFQLAIANVNRAMLYTKDDRLNRIDALNNVLERLKEVQGQTSQGQPLWWECQVLQIECNRLMGKTGAAQDLLNRVVDSQSADEIPQSVYEQQLWLALDQGNQALMLESLQATAKMDDRNPQLELARLEVMMYLAAQTDGQRNKQWLAAASQLTRTIENEHGGYWGRRAELVLIGPDKNRRVENPNIVGTAKDPVASSPNNVTSAELDLLIRLADNAVRNGRFEDAVKAYDKAARTASESGTDTLAFTLVVRASQALEKLQQYDQAASRLVNLSRRNTDARSNSAHLRGCWNFSQTIGNDAERQKEFGKLLAEHLATWPESSTANQARLWLAGHQQAEKDWNSAFQNYAGIEPTSPLFGDGIIRAVYCARRMLEESPEPEVQALANQITNRLQAVLNSSQPASDSYYETLLALSEIGVTFGTLNPAQLIEPLESLVASTENPDSQQRGRAWLLAVSAADPARAAIAEDLLNEISTDMRLLGIVERGLSGLVHRQTGETADRAKQLRLRVIESALLLSPEKRDLTFWLNQKSESLANNGRYEEALSVLMELQREFPRDAGIQLRIARLLTQIHESQDPARPLAHWRRLALKLEPQTRNWYEAKFQIASLLVKSGKKEEARQFLEYLKAVPPGWEQSHLNDEFDRLLAKCK